MNQNYAYFMKIDLSNYIGQWVAICNQQIVSYGKDAKKVFEEAKKRHPKERLLLTRVADEETMIF